MQHSPTKLWLRFPVACRLHPIGAGVARYLIRLHNVFLSSAAASAVKSDLLISVQHVIDWWELHQYPASSHGRSPALLELFVSHEGAR